MPAASRQAESVTSDDRYWPEGFVEELTDELTAALEVASDGELEFEFAGLEEKCGRAAVEITADLIADPRCAMSEEAGAAGRVPDRPGSQVGARA